jgi:pimeloyl-ACP methyl ester carboxylesterase
MRLHSSAWALVTATVLLQACATQRPGDPALMYLDQSKLPPADVSLNIPGLGPCTDNPDRSLRLNSRQPVTVLVHGCYGSSGQFRGLAQVFAFHGQQTACFTYDDRAGLDVSAAELAASLDRLVHPKNMPPPAAQVTLVGHSQGALVARRSLTAGLPQPVGGSEAKLRLVTISGPFAGIAAADACGSPLVRVLSLGLIGPLCRIGTGDKWADITYSSDFIRNPGALAGRVQSYLKIDTDERGSCRRTVNDQCVEDDFTFSLDEQRNAVVDRGAVTEIVEVKAGHVEIVGDNRVAPLKLIAVLQQNGIMRQTEPQRIAALGLLLARVYRDDSLALDPAMPLLQRAPRIQ